MTALRLVDGLLVLAVVAQHLKLRRHMSKATPTNKG